MAKFCVAVLMLISGFISIVHLSPNMPTTPGLNNLFLDEENSKYEYKTVNDNSEENEGKNILPKGQNVNPDFAAQDENIIDPKVYILFKNVAEKYECSCNVIPRVPASERRDFWQDKFTATYSNQFLKPHIAIPFIIIVFAIIALHIYLVDRLIQIFARTYARSKKHIHLAVANMLFSFLLTCVVFLLMLLWFKSYNDCQKYCNVV